MLDWIIIILICVLMLDGIIYAVFKNPQSFPDALTGFVRMVNISAARPQPAYDPACSKYDFDVNYRFKDGQCRHRSWEFDVTIRGNSQGLPDDESSLLAPEIIILGDSYAAGWGVEQEQAFPAQLEQLSGKKVLVAAAPSYATGRELILLEQLDRSAVKTVIIQYSENDAFENFEVFKNGEVQPIHHMVYRSISQTNLKRKRYLEQPYFPGKYVYLVYLALQQPTAPAPPDDDSKAEHFLGIIARSELGKMDNVNIIVLSVNQEHIPDQGFIDALTARLSSEPDPGFYSRVTAIGTTDALTTEDYFILDDHLRPSGHQKVAELLMETLDL